MPTTSPARHVLGQWDIERLRGSLSVFATDVRAQTQPPFEATDVAVLRPPDSTLYCTVEPPILAHGQFEHRDKQRRLPSAFRWPKSLTGIRHPTWWINCAVALVLFAHHNGQCVCGTMLANTPRVYPGITVTIEVSAKQLLGDLLKLSSLVVRTDYEISLASPTSLAILASQLCLTQLEGRSPRENKGRPSLFLEPVRATTASPERRIL